MSKESAAAFHSVVDVYERHTKTLRQLAEPIDAWSTMLEHLLCLRLDTGTLKAWEDFATTADNPDFNCLIDFLQRRARVLESMSVNHQAQPAPLYQPPMFRKPPFQKIVSHAAAETTHRQCHACDQHHPLFQCPQFENMSLPERLDLVNYDRLCHNCFRQNHIAQNCQSNFSCRHCKKRHHSLLHPGYYPIEDDLQPSTSHALAHPVNFIEKRNNASTVQRRATSTNAATVHAKDQAPLSNANVLLSTVVLLVVDSNEYLSLGHMRLVPENEIEPSLVHYLPHHAVLKQSSTTTKVRVVFDGSAKTSTGFSLNDALQVGPIIQDELLTLVLRFRKYPIALVADIEKMYRQVLLNPEDAPLQRILWRFDSHAPISTYELQTVTYGLATSSFLATRTLQQLAADEEDCYPLGGPALRKGFYVDDYIGGAETKEEAIQTRIALDELLRKGGFILRKWTSNNSNVLEDLDPSQIGTQPALKFDHHETIKTLGVSWEPATDQLRFDSSPFYEYGPPTKRSILSSVSKHFDPLGLTAPVIIRAKMLLQELWLQPCGWDEEVSDNIRTKWENYYAELPSLSSYRVNRYAFLPNSTVQLHTFADASQQAYGACIYARSTDSKELSAAVLAARLHKKVAAALDMLISTSFFWSDSTVTLEWLRSPPYTWNTFIANRVSEIQTSTHGSHWNHVTGKQNPADLITRGIKVSDFLNCDLWHHGPKRLKLPEAEWPAKTQHQKTQEDILERRRMVAAVQNKPCVNEIFKRFATYNRLIRVTAYCLRFIAACRRKLFPEQTPENSTTLTVHEITAARFKLIALAQTDVFAEEMRDLGKGYAISKRSDLRLLSPFVDPDGILRVGGRLKLSEQPYLTKHPILIPSSHPFRRLVVQHYHLKLLHGGGHSARILANSRTTSAKQQTGQLPLQRITPSRPFSVTGVDYAGPVYIKPIHKRAAPTKAYLSIFVCFVTKAVHIELVSDLSTPAFLSALRRFIARRGCPTHMHSDNGKNFEGARNELHALYQLLQKKKITGEIATHCANEGIQWHMIPPKAPHFGGLWEAAVKVAKKHLYRQLGNAMLSFEDMATVLAEIESAMNSRPLILLTEDPNDLTVLTPAHFLIGTSQSALPDADVSQMPIGRLDHYQRLQHRAQQFWYQWKTEYLQEMQKNNKHIAPNTARQIGSGRRRVSRTRKVVISENHQTALPASLNYAPARESFADRLRRYACCPIMKIVADCQR
ncbi:uncharacterized protein LOC131687333 [Topomyia yanbarensis]|uniref:uncharacterized protein LOC131687333 n=1 Tax=Topomyia yanbarensis TaxID=2498891 RepID=UPI00273BEF9D|nr:uncharacterized protein LOC131687333 [Topomyia yanbarensis]